jgi:hypothetical protein
VAPNRAAVGRLQYPRAVTSAKAVAHGKPIEAAGRAGLVAKGVSFGLVGVLAARVAVEGGQGRTPDRQGALREIAGDGIGRVTLVLLAIGFAGYALWRLAEAVFDRGGDGDDPPGLAKRAAAVAKAAIYAGLCATTIAILLDAGGSGGNSEDKWTQRLLDLPAGRLIVGAAGLGVIGAGLFNGYRALSGGFQKDMETYEMSAKEQPVVRIVGFVGHVARMVVFVLIGLFLLKAAWHERPNEAIGLDGALQQVAEQTYGRLLLGLVAVGVVAYGLFCLVQARYRKV